MDAIQIAVSSLIIVVVVHISVFYVVKFLYPSTPNARVSEPEPVVEFLPPPPVLPPLNDPSNPYGITRGPGPPPPEVFTKSPVVEQAHAGAPKESVSSITTNTQGGGDPRPLPFAESAADRERRVDLPIA